MGSAFLCLDLARCASDAPRFEGIHPGRSMKLSSFPSRLLSAFRAAEPEPAGTSLPDRYVSGLPSAQNAIDLIPGWNHAFPEEYGVRAGPAHSHHDPRILWCLEQAGGVAGRRVLELGPLEGMHSYMIARAGVGQLDAIEANNLAYLRCLISKEIFGLANVRYWLGDFRAWMDSGEHRYDLVVASGVLYHSPDPVGLIKAIAGVTSQFFIWTHYYDDCLATPEDYNRGRPFSGRTHVQDFQGSPITLHERTYYKAWNDPKFCGGMQDVHYWLTRADILRVIDLLGFDTTTTHEEVDHPNGPAFSLFAKRRQAQPAA